MKIVSFLNMKGGVGKTTTTLTIAYELAKESKKILIIDADLQSNLTQMLYAPYHEKKTFLDAIISDTELKELIVKAPNENYTNIDLVPADLDSLCVASEHLSVKIAKEKFVGKYLKANIETLKEYDYIFIDLAPSIDILARNFIYVSDSIVIPIQHADINALRGANRFLEILKRDLEDLDIKDQINKVAFINKNLNYKRDMIDLFNKFLDSESFKGTKDIILDSKIDSSTIIEKAIITKRAITDTVKKSDKMYKQIKNFIEELKNKEVL